MKTFCDTELLNGLRENDHEAFRYLYEKYWDKLYVVARKRLDNTWEAEEIVQDVFCKLWRRRETLSLKGGFENYLAVAVKFEVINRFAKRAHAAAYRQHLELRYSEADQDMLRQLDFDELQRRLETTIQTLPAKCSIVYRLSREQGFSNRQIAEELNISIKTVEGHLSRALKALRSVF